MLVHDLLTRTAGRTPDASAVIEPEGTVTYGEIDRRATSVACSLARAGVRPGDRVVLALPNSRAFVAAYFGILRAGAVVVPLPSGPRSDRMAAAVRDCTPTAAIVDESTSPLIKSCAGPHADAVFVMPRLRSGAVPEGAHALAGLDMDARAAAEGTRFEEPGIHERDLAAIIYTSGSTGVPRGVMLTHRNIAANTGSVVEYLSLSAADRVMVVLPFFYVYGLSLLHTHVAVGGSVVLENQFVFSNRVLKAMQAHRVTGFAGVPSTFALLLHRSALRTMSFPSLRYVTQAGGPMPPARILEWLDAMPTVPFFVMYGATEAAARLTYLPPAELRQRLGSVGHAIPRVQLKILREDGTPASSHEVGEIVAAGDNISPGYWNCQEETQRRFGPEGFRTGDLGYADRDGYLYLVGRRHDMIKVGAHRVSAQEIEAVLNHHAAVHEAAVVGVPHPLWGESPVGHVALRSGSRATAADIVAFCRARLPDHMIPTAIEFHDELPKNGAGKLEKSALVTMRPVHPTELPGVTSK